MLVVAGMELCRVAGLAESLHSNCLTCSVVWLVLALVAGINVALFDLVCNEVLSHIASDV